MGIDLAVCAYCGFHRECLDHCPPLSIAVTIDLDKFRKSGGALMILPACNECNSMLGKRNLPTWYQRLSHLYTAYAEKIKIRTWEESEIAQLGRGLKAYVKQMNKLNMQRIEKLRGIEMRILNADEEFPRIA